MCMYLALASGCMQTESVSVQRRERGEERGRCGGVQ